MRSAVPSLLSAVFRKPFLALLFQTGQAFFLGLFGFIQTMVCRIRSVFSSRPRFAPTWVLSCLLTALLSCGLTASSGISLPVQCPKEPHNPDADQ